MSKRIHTHYDNLKVAQDAPIEVIRAAYRSLCKKYHPDQNSGNPDAGRIMSLINRSYAVLSDPEQRRAHDEWIAAQQAGHTGHDTGATAPYQPHAGHDRPSENLWPQRVRQVRQFAFGLLFFALLLGGLFWLAQEQRKAAADMPANRTAAAPAPYPEFAQYLEGFPILAETGNGMVKVGNRNNRSAVFVQLYPDRSGTAIRTFYIPAHADFTVFKLAPGTYRLRYCQIATDVCETAAFGLSDGQPQAQNITLESARTDTP